MSKKDKMDRACSTYGREEKLLQGFWLESPKEIDHQEGLDICGRILLKRILQK
jgi:hypothetical protein